MSRVDDASADRRAEEARAADRRAQELARKQRTAEASAFDRALAGKAPPPAAAREAAEEEGGEGGAAAHDEPFAAAPDETEPEAGAARRRAAARAPVDRDAPPLPGSRRAPPPRPGVAAPEEKGELARAADLRPQPRPGAPRTPLAKPGARSAQAEPVARRPDAKTEDIDRDVVERAPRRVQEGQERDARGQGGSPREPRRGPEAEPMAAFKLPPAALMAPPPLARPKAEAAGRLAGATREIIDQIVRRVLVGLNERGVPEFRLDLKSSVLEGLSIRISGGRGGRIRAVFSGGDKEVLAALRQTSGDLQQALAAKGLTLEELVIEP